MVKPATHCAGGNNFVRLTSSCITVITVVTSVISLPNMNSDLETSLIIHEENHTIDETVESTANNLDNQGVPIMSVETIVTNQSPSSLLVTASGVTTADNNLITSPPATPNTEGIY